MLVMVLFLLTTTTVLATSTSPLPGLTTTEKDLLCACRGFHTPASKLEHFVERDLAGRDVECVKHGFYSRWTHLFKATGELGVGWGLRAQVYTTSSQQNEQTLLVAFRHFEFDNAGSWIDRDGWQMFAMHGEETGAGFYGPWLAYWLSSYTQVYRHLLAIDYNREASQMMREVMDRPSTPKRILFTGFGAGGSVAAVQASRLKSTSAVVFMAHGVGGILPFYGYQPTRRVVNLVMGTRNFLLGKQANKVCEFAGVDDLGEGEAAATARLLYHPRGFISVNTTRVCVDELGGQDLVKKSEL
jgi:hypothetical protein